MKVMMALRRVVILLIITLILLVPLAAVSAFRETRVEQTFRLEPGEHVKWDVSSEGDKTLYLTCKSHFFSFSLYLIRQEEYQDLVDGRDFESEEEATGIYSANLTWEVPKGEYYLVAVNDLGEIGINLDIKIEVEEGGGPICCGSFLIGSILVIGAFTIVLALVRKRSGK